MPRFGLESPSLPQCDGPSLPISVGLLRDLALKHSDDRAEQILFLVQWFAVERATANWILDYKDKTLDECELEEEMRCFAAIEPMIDDDSRWVHQDPVAAIRNFIDKNQ